MKNHQAGIFAQLSLSGGPFVWREKQTDRIDRLDCLFCFFYLARRGEREWELKISRRLGGLFLTTGAHTSKRGLLFGVEGGKKVRQRFFLSTHFSFPRAGGGGKLVSGNGLVVVSRQRSRTTRVAGSRDRPWTSLRSWWGVPGWDGTGGRSRFPLSKS